MKERICFVTLLTIGIVAALIIFFEKRDNQSTDAFDGVLVYESVMERNCVSEGDWYAGQKIIYKN